MLASTKLCENCGNEFSRDVRNTWAYWAKAKFCSRECFGETHSKRAEAVRRPMREDFDRWVDKSGECWLWTGACEKDRYGAYSYAGKTQRAHVVALILDGRPPAKGEYACHHCDNPQCVRPDHLYPGTPKQNVDDAFRRKRMKLGEAKKSAKLTDDAVREIRVSSLAPPELAAKFGVSSAAIHMVIKGRTWRHVQ